jgi:hypothetical protein
VGHFPTLKKQIYEKYPDVSFAALWGEEAATFLAAFNSSEPISNFEGEVVYFFHSKKANDRVRGDTTYMVVGDMRGCYKHAGEVRTRDLPVWRSGKIVTQDGNVSSHPRFPPAQTWQIKLN